MSALSARLNHLRQTANLAGLADITRGLEKESLRVGTAGTLSLTPHPTGLGSALTHPHITTDYSEALLEFITDPSKSIDNLIETLNNLHRFTYRQIGEESLWVNSMPCMLMGDTNIPIARYGSSNIGKMKSVYRLGLGHRYGRSMQTIAGIHFNFSVNDDLWEFLRNDEKSSLSLAAFKTEGYFKLIRNFRRYFWLLLYLFGAAPAVCRSFVKDKPHQLIPISDDLHSLHTPYATSLRMGNLGYQSSAQESLVITYNCLSSYIKTLCQAITQPHPQYQSIGIFDAEGQYQQLNDCLLQIENEFYSVIRPKRTSNPGQTALNALSSGGVEYIEVRCLDLNPFEPVGINAEQIRFLDCFLLFCLLEDSPLSDEKEVKQLQDNQRRMVYEGRDPNLSLFHFGTMRQANEWGKEMIAKIDSIANLLDQHNGNNDYQTAVKAQHHKLDDSSLTPSAKIIKAVQEEGITFYQWAMNQALQHREQFLSQHLTPEILQQYRDMAQTSIQEQVTIEAEDNVSFEQYIASYYQQYRCCNDAVTEPNAAQQNY